MATWLLGRWNAPPRAAKHALRRRRGELGQCQSGSTLSMPLRPQQQLDSISKEL